MTVPAFRLRRPVRRPWPFEKLRPAFAQQSAERLLAGEAGNGRNLAAARRPRPPSTHNKSNRDGRLSPASLGLFFVLECEFWGFVLH
jgi:hypothetical protein